MRDNSRLIANQELIQQYESIGRRFEQANEQLAWDAIKGGEKFIHIIRYLIPIAN